MAGNAIQVTDQDFDEKILNGGKPAMVDFWAVWCGPCRIIAPHVEALAQEYAGKAIVAKLDVDQNRQTAIRFGIQSIPTLLFFKDGKLVDRVVGAVDKKVLQSKLEALLA
ncbi:MAG: thioredoxin [Acidobacteriota bacterium]|jgi:thioredoxin 1|uniref:Thioredoxin n=1 Tax=Thermoanaerobaculum aquaticum TaxID=1312852 RepID=A0A062XS20_9BACT|nr:thioredoxin [Thermoanaerobaculum aquaticum]KDA53638.1 thioredoxin [Thermoanaerobaculum aquaticum]BCW94179.1 MAG: thioredoxin [Thermoanaerobaculum sp.]GBC79374.1 Thioredoxin [bacterium HR09]